MRTSILAFTVLSLVPTVALADDDEKPKVVVVNQRNAHGFVEREYVPPSFAPYEGGDIPPGAKIENKPNSALIATGLSVFGASYLGALIYGIATCSAQMECRDGSGFLYLPVVGPFITAATAPTTGGAALAAFDGGLQVLGAGLTLAGFIWQKKFVMWQSHDNTAQLKVLPTGGAAPTGSNVAGVTGGASLTLTHQ